MPPNTSINYITVYNPITDEYSVHRIYLNTMDGYIDDINEVIFDFKNGIFYVNDTDSTQSLMSYISDLTSLEQIVGILI